MLFIAFDLTSQHLLMIETRTRIGHIYYVMR